MFFLSPKLQFDIELIYNFIDFLNLRDSIRFLISWYTDLSNVILTIIWKGILIFGNNHLSLLLSIVFLSQGAFNNHPEFFQQLLAIMQMILKLTIEPTNSQLQSLIDSIVIYFEIISFLWYLLFIISSIGCWLWCVDCSSQVPLLVTHIQLSTTW